jgi:hypothetical protein
MKFMGVKYPQDKKTAGGLRIMKYIFISTVKNSGYFMDHKPKQCRTLYFGHELFLCSVCFSEKIHVVPLNNINQIVSIIESVDKRALSLEVKRPGREADHSPPASTEVKEMWMYTSILPYAFMAYCLTS